MTQAGGGLDALFGAAVLKLSFLRRGATDDPGFRFVYFGTLRQLGLTDREVDAYLAAHRDELEEHLRRKRPPERP